MRIKLGNGLLPVNLLTWILIAAILFFPSYYALRIIIGILFVLFFPGYTLVLALFPREEGISGIQRAGLSFGLSIAVVPLIGLALNYTAWGITLQSISYSVTSFIFVLSCVAWVRQKRLTKEECFSIEFELAFPGWAGGIWDKILSIILVVCVLGTLGIMGYLIVRPKIGERISEFYALDLEGKAADYPVQLVVGQEGKVIIGIINHEYETVIYGVEVRIDGVKYNEVESLVLDNDHEWKQEVSFIPQKAGEHQKVEFLLYKDGETDPCLEPLRLWIDVTEQ